MFLTKKPSHRNVVRRILPVVVWAALFLFAAGEVIAQDSHYWTLQYGPRSSLLGGAVIGAVDDVSATFYNPGALSQANNLAFAVSTDVFELRVLRTFVRKYTVVVIAN